MDLLLASSLTLIMILATYGALSLARDVYDFHFKRRKKK